jgi:hypothetical protein
MAFLFARGWILAAKVVPADVDWIGINWNSLNIAIPIQARTTALPTAMWIM